MNVGVSSKIGRTIRIGGKATQTAMRNAESISLGMNRRAETVGRRAQSAYTSVKKSIHRGSSAGLRNEKPAHLITNGTGYFNSAHHGARYRVAKQQSLGMNLTGNIRYNGIGRSTSSDFRLTSSKTNSIARLNAMVK